jgi:hypothetical protein
MFRSLCLAAALSGGGSPFAAESEISRVITDAELRAHVFRLASAEFLGRRGSGGERAAEHIAAAFKKIGLQPAFGESYFQPIPWLLGKDKKESVGRNVGGMIVGSDPELRDEWIVVAAHYDHLGVQGDLLYPGADDNASGVAMLLEVAEQFALNPIKPRRTIVFVAFDLEEQGLQGSAHFAAHPPRDYGKLKAFLVADLIGRSMANLMDEYVFVLGSESAEHLQNLVAEVRPETGLETGRLGADLVGTRSDYGPFRDRQTPFLFFTTGTHRDYHRPTDRPERIDYAKLGRISRWIAKLSDRLANDAKAPSWLGRSEPDADEARTVLLLLTRVLERPAEHPMSAEQLNTVRRAQSRLQEIVRREKVTPEERTWLVWTARYLMVSVF